MENKQLSIRLSPEVRRRVEAECQKLGVTINAYITMILWKELGERAGEQEHKNSR